MGLVAVAIWIVVEAFERLGHPRPIDDVLLLVVALAGLAVNVVGLLLLRPHAERSLNVRSAVWHILGDTLGSLGAVSAALVVRFTGWTGIDPLIGMGIALLIGVGALRILYDSINFLLDSVPKELDTGAVSAYLTSYPDVSRICDLHIWGVSSTEAVLTAHLIVRQEVDRDSFLAQLVRELRQRFGLAHLTIQLENKPQDSCSPDW
jgi:cobalt-zinc-cadmium efflux system protein